MKVSESADEKRGRISRRCSRCPGEIMMPWHHLLPSSGSPWISGIARRWWGGPLARRPLHRKQTPCWWSAAAGDRRATTPLDTLASRGYSGNRGGGPIAESLCRYRNPGPADETGEPQSHVVQRAKRVFGIDRSELVHFCTSAEPPSGLARGSSGAVSKGRRAGGPPHHAHTLYKLAGKCLRLHDHR